MNEYAILYRLIRWNVELFMEPDIPLTLSEAAATDCSSPAVTFAYCLFNISISARFTTKILRAYILCLLRALKVGRFHPFIGHEGP